MVRPHAWLAAAVLAGVAALAAHADAAPKKQKKQAPEPAAVAKEEVPDFDRTAAANAIIETNLQKCKATNAAKGDGHVTITFAAAGTAQHAAIDKGPWVGTPVAKCMVKAFKKTKIPAFKGEPVTVGKTFHFE